MRGSGNGRAGGFLSKTKLLTLVALLAFGAVAIAACGGDDGADESDAPTTAAEGDSSGLPDLSGTTITYVGFGGTTDEAMDRAWFTPFEEATGAEVVLDSPTDYKKLQVQVESGNVSYDIVDGDAFVMDPGCGKDWEEINAPNVKHVLPEYKPKSKCSVPDYVYSYVIASSPELFPEGGPNDCADFYDTDQFPGKRQLWSYYYGGPPECAAIAAGADPKNPYPLDMDSMVSELEGIKGDMDVFDTPQQAADAMLNNDAAMGIYTTRMILAGQDAGADWKIADGWSATANGTFGIPKGAPNKEAAETLLNYILDPENNKRFYEELPAYGSPQGVTPDSAKEMDPWLVSGSKQITDAGFIVDWDWWATNDAEFSQKWAAVTTG